MYDFWWAEVMTIIALPIYGITILLELVVSHFAHKKLYSGIDTANNLFFTSLNFGIDTLVRGSFLWIMSWLYTYKFITWPQDHNSWLYWVAVLVITDLAYWVVHWMGHTVRLFWAVHVIHHSSQEYNISVGFRSSVFEPLYRGVFFLPLALLGFKAADVMLAFAIQQLYGSLVHTKLINRLGIIEKFMVTPSHHRVHHASNVRYLDKNMGMITILWDKLFGTFEPEDSQYEPIQYGLTTNYTFQNPIKILFAEFAAIANDVRKAPNMRSKLMYIFGPPGWSHNGSSKTSKELQKLN